MRWVMPSGETLKVIRSRAIATGPVVGHSQIVHDWNEQILTQHQMVEHGQFRAGQAEDLPRRARRAVDAVDDVFGDLEWQVRLFGVGLGRYEGFVDQDVGVLAVLDDVLARLAVAQVDERQAVPFEPVAVRPVDAVQRRESGDDDAVLVVDLFVLLGVVELVEDRLCGPRRG